MRLPVKQIYRALSTLGLATLILLLAIHFTPLIPAWARALARVDRMAATPEELLDRVAKEVAEQPGDEIEDPMGLTDEAYALCAQRLDELVPVVVRGLARVTS